MVSVGRITLSSDNINLYFRSLISFEKIALELSNKNVGLGFGMNVGLNKTEKAVLGLLIEDSDRIYRYIKITRDDIVEECSCTPNHASWLLCQLVKDNVIQSYGAGRSTFYKKL